MLTEEPLSIVVLTKDEEHNLPDCLDALVPQLEGDDEIVIVDAASHDRTVEIARGYAARFPRRIVVEASPTPLGFGAARNRAIEIARSPSIVMLSADAVPEAGWLAALRAALADADVVYGRQRHAPTRHNAATVSRGLRYHRFEGKPTGLPETYASNVNAAYRRAAFASARFDEAAPGAEDVAFAREARLAGLRIVYAEHAVVRHRDVSSFGAEWRKHVREGAAHAHLQPLLGLPRWHLAWAVAVAGMGLLAIVAQSPVVLVGTVIVFFAPTLRRLRGGAAKRYRPFALARGVAASPLFDLAYVGSYLNRRARA